MTSKMVRLDEDVYEHIKSKKRDDETFSEAIERLTSEWTLLDLAGTLTEEEAEEHRELIRRSEEAGSEELKEQLGLDEA